MSKIHFQEPRGTRDFYPEEMAVRRYLEDAWRRVSVRHGFVEVDGPTFEYLDLYKIKSGDEIVSQLFCLDGRPDKEGKVEHYALRPEFTPTLARMVAAKANSLPRPIKWFCIPRCYRGETPQKGRGREFIQWNVDLIGGETPEQKALFDVEEAALCLDMLREVGLTEKDVALLWNDRLLVENLFAVGGVPPERYAFGLSLLDRLAKLAPDQRAALYRDNGVSEGERAFFERLAGGANPLEDSFWQGLAAGGGGVEMYRKPVLATRERIEAMLGAMGFGGWARYDASIVRGLAYYTGFVFEVADIVGQSRAVAGGGRYDRLIEMFDGPSLPAVGFGMGDMVLADLLRERGKLPGTLLPRADVFVVNALADGGEAMRLLAKLRESQWDAEHKAIVRHGLRAISSYKATKNIGKLLQDAAASGARVAVILAPAEFGRGVVKIKDLASREEREVPAAEVVAEVREVVG